MATTNLYAVHAGKDGDALKAVKRGKMYEERKHIHTYSYLRCTSSTPEECKKRFEKTRSRMVHHAIWGIGVHPNKRPMAVIGHRDIAC